MSVIVCIITSNHSVNGISIIKIYSQLMKLKLLYFRILFTNREEYLFIIIMRYISSNNDNLNNDRRKFIYYSISIAEL